MMLQIYLLLLCLALANGSSCPKQCSCKIVGKVDCSRKELSSIPADIPPTTTWIDLSMNDITSVPDNAFAKAPKLKKIDLRHNSIASLGNAAFEGIERLDSLFLISNQLDDKTDWTSISNQPYLTKLYLSHNLLTVIPSLQAPKISRLILDGNQISSANFPKVFTVCNNLESVVLANNAIEAITSTDFDNLAGVAIKSLDFKLNSLNQIDPNAFVKIADSLETIDLDHNRLDVDMISTMLKGLKTASKVALLTLSLSYNSISRLDADLLTPLSVSSIRNLQLDGNILGSVDPLVFTPVAKTLVLLSLRECGLSKLTFDTTILRNLQDLHLDGNRLVSLPAKLPKSLQRLTASGIGLSEWPGSYFDDLPSIVGLDLSKNAIRNLAQSPNQKNALSTNLQERLTRLDLQTNLFNCTCDLAWFIKWAEKNAKKVVNFKKYECSSPSAVAFKLLADFDIKNCSNARPQMLHLDSKRNEPQVRVIQISSRFELLAVVAIVAMALVCIVTVLAMKRPFHRTSGGLESDKAPLMA